MPSVRGHLLLANLRRCLRENGSRGLSLCRASVHPESRSLRHVIRRAFKVVRLAGIEDFKCVKSMSFAGGDATGCVENDASPETASSEDKLLADFNTFCTSPPAFATNGGTCCEGGTNDGDPCSVPSDCSGGACTPGACISGAAADAAVAVAHDLFGPAVGAGATGKCQALVFKMAGLVHAERWRSLFKCKQVNIVSLTIEADFVATCLGPPQPPYANFAGREVGSRPRFRTSVSTRA